MNTTQTDSQTKWPQPTRREGIEHIASLPDAGPWHTRAYSGTIYANSQTSGLYRVTEQGLERIEPTSPVAEVVFISRWHAVTPE